MPLFNSVNKFELTEPIDIDQFHALMENNWDKSTNGNFTLQKGLFKKFIQFDEKSHIKPTITIQNNVLTIKKVSNPLCHSQNEEKPSFRVISYSGLGNNPSFDMDAGQKYYEDTVSAVYKFITY